MINQKAFEKCIQNFPHFSVSPQQPGGFLWAKMLIEEYENNKSKQPTKRSEQ